MVYLGPSDRTLVFKEANVQSSAVGSLGKNDNFWLLRKSYNNEWARISLENGKEAWIKLFTYKDYKNPHFPIKIVKSQ